MTKFCSAARAAAEQFARDSGGIKSATQGYFSIEPCDGEADGSSDTPYNTKAR